MNNIVLDLGIIKIYWYSVFVLAGFLVGSIIALREAKKHKISENFMINYVFYVVPISIIGARLYFVLFNFSYYKENLIDILKIWEGGLAIHGGLLSAIIFTFIYTKKYNVRFLRLLDILVVPLLVGQAIGRWGNFMNHEAYGSITTLKELQSKSIPNFIIEGMNIGGIYYTPTFFYESIWCFIGFIALFALRRYKKLKVGVLTSLYLIWYGIGRFYIEGLRQDSLMLGNFKIARLISLLFIIVGTILLIIKARNNRIVNLYNTTEENNSDRV
jgi:prolipoprotein diacylglyceryl transferase